MFEMHICFLPPPPKPIYITYRLIFFNVSLSMSKWVTHHAIHYFRASSVLLKRLITIRTKPNRDIKLLLESFWWISTVYANKMRTQHYVTIRSTSSNIWPRKIRLRRHVCAVLYFWGHSTTYGGVMDSRSRKYRRMMIYQEKIIDGRLLNKFHKIEWNRFPS